MKNLIMLILGATGDLAKKKLIPSLYNLVNNQKENLNVFFIGAAKDKIDIHDLLDEVHVNIKNINHETWIEFKKNSYYVELNFENPDDFKKLADQVILLERSFNQPATRFAYLATSSDFYCSLTKNLVNFGIIRNQNSIVDCDRIAYEKPFGQDLKSAQELNNCVNKLLNENQIYRVDHYLTKALVDSIIPIRFSNIIFEPIWNSEYIDHVQIVLSETDSVEDRAQFYDKHGALKDVVQNHMFQILSFIAMEKPENFEIEPVNKGKAEVLKNLSIEDVIIGQYEGYLENVKPDSKTETFAILKCILNNGRWSGVPFYLKTGKCLDIKSTEVHVVFKKIDQHSNILTIRISPNAQLSITLNVRQRDEKIVPINMDFCYRCHFGYETPHSYEFLLSEIIQNDRYVSISFDQIKYSWLLIDNIKKLKLPLYLYKCNSSGPKESESFASKNNFHWLL